MSVDVSTLKEGQLLRHLPTGRVGRVKWLPTAGNLPFLYITVDGEHPAFKGGATEYIQQGQPQDYEEVEDASD